MNLAFYSHFTDEQTDLRQFTQLTSLGAASQAAWPLTSYSQTQAWSPAGGEVTSALQVSLFKYSLEIITLFSLKVLKGTKLQIQKCFRKNTALSVSYNFLQLETAKNYTGNEQLAHFPTKHFSKFHLKI